MKKVSFVVAATFGLMSFGALAGGDCIYGQKHSLAKAIAEDATLVGKVDPALLALVKKQEAKAEQVQPIVTFN